MKFTIKTFENPNKPHVFFKAINHPLVQEKVRRLRTEVEAKQPGVIFDPHSVLEDFLSLLSLSSWEPKVIVIDRRKLLPGVDLDLSFERRSVAPLSLEPLRIPERFLKFPDSYLDPMNFASDYALFRNSSERHTRLATANYWARHGARDSFLFFNLFDSEGHTIAQWEEPLASHESEDSIVLGSEEIAKRYGLNPYEGQLFIHCGRPEGHPTIKYVLDFIDGRSGGSFSTTHDSNSYPADVYSGIPAPAPGHDVFLWMQNPHRVAVPRNSIFLTLDEENTPFFITDEIPPFGTRVVGLKDLMPRAKWPSQISVHGKKFIGRPRYEIIDSQKRWFSISHANVRRCDLSADTELLSHESSIGKGYLICSPILFAPEIQTSCVLTAMSTSQSQIPLQTAVYSKKGEILWEQAHGLYDTANPKEIFPPFLAEAGHLECRYDFGLMREIGVGVDGWMHAAFRYRHQKLGQIVDTSFGAHIFNVDYVFRDEPQSYFGKPPGLRTRLYMRLCQTLGRQALFLIYPASKSWHPFSDTQVFLVDQKGSVLESTRLQIPCHGSFSAFVEDIFPLDRLKDADHLRVIDKTCRLFGYHSSHGDGGTFAIDHCFGF